TEEQVRFRARDGQAEFVYFSQAMRGGELAEWKSWRFVIASAKQISANELELLGAFSEFDDVYRFIVWEKKDGRFRLKSIRMNDSVYGVKDHVSVNGREY